MERVTDSVTIESVTDNVLSENAREVHPSDTGQKHPGGPSLGLCKNKVCWAAYKKWGWGGGGHKCTCKYEV